MRSFTIIAFTIGMAAGCTPIGIVSTVADVAVGTVTTAGGIIIDGVAAGADVVVGGDEND